MPKVKGYTHRQKIDYQRDLMTKKCRLIMVEHHISQTRLAEYLDITQGAVNSQLKNGVTLPLFMAIMTLADSDQATISQLVKVGDL